MGENEAMRRMRVSLPISSRWGWGKASQCKSAMESDAVTASASAVLRGSRQSNGQRSEVICRMSRSTMSPICWLDTARWPMPYDETATSPFSLQQRFKESTGGSLLDLYSKFVGLISGPPLSGDAHVIYAGW